MAHIVSLANKMMNNVCKLPGFFHGPHWPDLLRYSPQTKMPGAANENRALCKCPITLTHTLTCLRWLPWGWGL